ncbi:MAG: PDZ domain-containing protein [Actinomycetota bacterium]|nr:PDZ domain-containing protein [Actinomycetota bacterium]
MTDLRLERLNQNVLSMLELENLIGGNLNGLDPRVLAALPNGFAVMIDAHREALLGYLRSAGVDPGVTRPTTSAVRASPFPGGVGAAGDRSATAATLFAEVSYAAVGYAALFELSLKLFDKDLRDIAPRHLRTYRDAASSLAAHLARIMADELAEDDLECQCICPMCSLGACGCVEVGRQEAAGIALTEADAPSEGGFILEPPRKGSQLREAGIVAGDVLSAIDGESVRTIQDIQDAIRRHRLGERVRLLITHGDSDLEVEVTHISDY